MTSGELPLDYARRERFQRLFAASRDAMKAAYPEVETSAVSPLPRPSVTSRSASSKTSSPRMARSVIAAIFAPLTARLYRRG